MNLRFRKCRCLPFPSDAKSSWHFHAHMKIIVVYVRLLRLGSFIYSVVAGSRRRSTMIHWRSGMAHQPPLPWSENTMAPKHLISWFPHPTSCFCCSQQTTAALLQASASDMKVRLTDRSVCYRHIYTWPLDSDLLVLVWCEFQVWKWSQTHVLILVSQSMAVAMATPSPLALGSLLHVNLDTHLVMKSQ